MTDNFYDTDFDRYAYLRDLAKKAGFPVIRITESACIFTYPDESGFTPDFDGEYLIDTSKFGEDSKYLHRLDYVGRIIEAALLGKTELSSTQRFSFGDTPDWWDIFAPDTLESRKIRNIDVNITY